MSKVKPPEHVQKAEKAFYRCPGGHELPHRTENGQCTPLFCSANEMQEGGRSAENRLKRLKKERGNDDALVRAREAAAKGVGVDPAIETAITAEGDEGAAAKELARVSKVDETARLGKAMGRHLARHNFLKVPKGLEGAEAEQWADSKLVNLLPDAVAELEYQLKLGDDSQRERAAKMVLESMGRGRRESGGGSNAPVIIIAGGAGGQVQVPWAQKVAPPTITADNAPKRLQTINVTEAINNATKIPATVEPVDTEGE